jgi:hypothetical protein
MTGRKHEGTPLDRPWLRLLISMLTIGLFLPGSVVSAEDFLPPSMPEEPTQWRIPAAETLVDGRELAVASVGDTKLESSLAQLLDTHLREGVAQAEAFAAAREMVLDGGRVQVVIVTTPETIDDLKGVVESLGGEYQGRYEGLLQALVPIDTLDSLVGRPDVQRVREPRRPVPLEPVQVGSQTTEGVARSNASAWHTAGYDGTGVKVAVIDGGFTGYTGLLGTDLPASVTTYDWIGSGMGGSPHGTACAEIVHDMAPGATMYLHRISTDVDLGQAVTQAIADGVDVISMSLGWTIDGPGDGTGSLASMVNSARSNGIFFAVAAGNNAEENWAGTFVDSGYNDYHDWDGSGLWFNWLGPGGGSCYVYTAGTTLSGGLHWDDWTSVNQNYDLHLYRWPGTGTILYRMASSTNSQNGGVGQTPEEFLVYTASGTDCYAWVVERVSSTRNVCLRLATPKMGHLDQWTPQRSLSFPADSPDAITVGAVDVDSPYPLESYSSQGPTFGTGGSCTGGSTKPDIAAYANVSTVSYGAGGFNGTSAATPHVGGAAVLVKDAYPGYTVTQMQSYLESSAMDLGTSGKDSLYGSGRLYLGIPPAGTDPTVTSITPNTGVNTGIVSVTVVGSNFQSGATIKLTKSGQSDINAPPGTVSESQITCDLDLTGAAIGAWNVVVTNPDSQSGTLPNGFTVTAPGEDTFVYLPLAIRMWPPPPTTFYPTEDAGIYEGQSGNNYGDYADMYVGYGKAGCFDLPAFKKSRSLLKFDLSGISGLSISEAKLYLRVKSYCSYVGHSQPRTVTVYRANANWSESSVTWNNKPGYAEAYGSASVPLDTGEWHSFDVTSLVRGWMNGSFSNQGLMLRASETSGDEFAWIGFFTGESSSDPYISITYDGIAASEEIVPVTEQIPGSVECELDAPDRSGAFPLVNYCAAYGSNGQTLYGSRD